jgi:hypothetical protein
LSRPEGRGKPVAKPIQAASWPGVLDRQAWDEAYEMRAKARSTLTATVPDSPNRIIN